MIIWVGVDIRPLSFFSCEEEKNEIKVINFKIFFAIIQKVGLWIYSELRNSRFCNSKHEVVCNHLLYANLEIINAKATIHLLLFVRFIVTR